MKILFALLTALLPLSLLAHPGHGLGSLGHGLDHAFWNFLGLIAVCAAILVWQRWGSRRNK